MNLEERLDAIAALLAAVAVAAPVLARLALRLRSVLAQLDAVIRGVEAATAHRMTAIAGDAAKKAIHDEATTRGVEAALHDRVKQITATTPVAPRPTEGDR